MDTAQEFQETAWALACCEANGYGSQWITDIHALIKDWTRNERQSGTATGHGILRAVHGDTDR